MSPLALVVLALTFRFRSREPQRLLAEEHRRVGERPLAALALGGIVYALIGAQTAGWDRSACACRAADRPRRRYRLFSDGLNRAQAAPLVPLALFSARGIFAATNLLTLAALCRTRREFCFFLPLNLIQVQGYPATAAGRGSAAHWCLLMFRPCPRWGGRALVDRLRRPIAADDRADDCGSRILHCSPFRALGVATGQPSSPRPLVLGFGMDADGLRRSRPRSCRP